MLNTLWIAENCLDPSTWIEIQTDDVLATLVEHYGDSFPSNARIYHEQVSEQTDVTPSTEDSVNAFMHMRGTFFVVHYPEGPVAIIAVVAIVAVVAMAFFLKPSIPVVSQRESNSRGSSNNSLSERKNDIRIGERIPNILGTVRSYPDQYSPAYKLLEGTQEIEHSLMVISRGYLQIHDAFEGETRFDSMAGASLQVYDPGKDFINDTPIFSIGAQITDPWHEVYPVASVTGQTLLPPNVDVFEGDNNIFFTGPDSIELSSSSDRDFTDYIEAGTEITVTNSVSNGNTLDLNGTYVVLTVVAKKIVLSNPVLANPNWGSLSGSTPTCSANLTPDADKWVGPFDMTTQANRSYVIVNIRGPQGLYYVGNSSGNQYKTTVDFTIEFIQIDNLGNPLGPVDVYNGSITGSATSRDSVGVSVIYQTSFTGPCRVRMRRTSDSGDDSGAQHVETIKVTEIYSSRLWSSYHVPHTHMRTKIYSTASALSASERKTNLRVTSRLPPRLPDNTFDVGNTAAYAPTADAADIMCYIIYNTDFGKKPQSTIDVQNIYDTVAEARDYFGYSESVGFNYTFDDASISFEEALSSVAQAIHCVAYRRGNKYRIFFEKETNDAVLLFNHRNKRPGSEKRTVSFGRYQDYDGVEINWNDPDDFDSQQTLRIPDDGRSNYKKLEVRGIRNLKQATVLAWRAYQKMTYQNVKIEMSAMDDANILLLTERVLNSDNTRSSLLEGSVTAVLGTMLTVSPQVRLDSSKTYSMFLQLSDGTVESIPVVQGPSYDKVMLSYAPRLPLVTDSGYYATTLFHIVASDETQIRAFLVDEITSNDDMTVDLKLVNYDSRYYLHDKDYHP
ncbi:host specificity factor TipJ family phage tail protein [Bdellovibrio sp. 22V]|uniref:host specificity factor TipJ family phage tail protein n=1 Tax=Bdellovibrio sp. 22V TaxID=3044166 RepID=UPI002543784F|nr:host specificity factor TipJ family phage tail protein [Bdellovibrio sp. 22V]WII71718.1 host specificity factor TipJ family phage tail protein [Bdellovibrio sp. 22V]